MPKPMRRKSRPKRKSDRTLLLKLALVNARYEREKAEMMDGLLGYDQDWIEHSEYWEGPSDDDLVDEDIDWRRE